METEHEFRFGSLTEAGFSASVQQPMYTYLYHRAKSLGAHFSEPQTYTIRYCATDHRVVDGAYQTKTVLERTDFFIGAFAIRYCKSVETPIEGEPPPGGAEHTKTRTSAVLLDTLRLDFSVLDGTVFQVELEVTDGNLSNPDVSHLLQMLCRWDYLPPAVPLPILAASDYISIVARHNELFGFATPSRRRQQPWYRVARAVDMPVPLPPIQNCIVSYKYDGVRGLLARLDTTTYFVNMQGLVVLDLDEVPRGCILDVEAWQGKFVVLDVLVSGGTSVRDRPFSERIEKFTQTCSLIVPMEMYAVTRETLRPLWNSVLNHPSLYDGLIVRQNLAPYRDGESFKIKPLNRITVDLEVQPDGGLYAWNKAERRMVRWSSFHLRSLEPGIWEFLYSGPEHLEPVRMRPDRRTPNSLDTIESVLITARNPWIFDMLLERAGPAFET